MRIWLLCSTAALATFYGTYDYSIIEYRCLGEDCAAVPECDETQFSTLSVCAANIVDREALIRVRKRWILGSGEYCSNTRMSTIVGLDLWPLKYEGLSIAHIVDEQPIIFSDVINRCGNPIVFHSAAQLAHTNSAPECLLSRWPSNVLPQWTEALEFDVQNNLMFMKKEWFTDDRPRLLVASFMNSDPTIPSGWCAISFSSTTRVVFHTDEIVRARDVPYTGFTTRNLIGGTTSLAGTRTSAAGWEDVQVPFPTSALPGFAATSLLLSYFFNTLVLTF